MNIGSIPFETMKKLVIDVHKKEGIITMSWHPNSPKTNGDSWDNTAAVRDIIGNVFTKKKIDYMVMKGCRYYQIIEL